MKTLNNLNKHGLDYVLFHDLKISKNEFYAWLVGGAVLAGAITYSVLVNSQLPSIYLL